MVRNLPLGLEEALKMTLERLAPLDTVQTELTTALDRALAQDVYAGVDSPSVDASMKDGFAVVSGTIDAATRENPVRLKLVDCLAAGESRTVEVQPNTAVRVLTGAGIPSGADAVVAEEFTQWKDDMLTVYNNAGPGRNILPRGSDVASGQRVAGKGDLVTPGLAGMLAASGRSHLSVVRRPSVAIIATGDEIVAPGHPLPEGKLYASNMTTLGGWCHRYGLRARMAVVEDDEKTLTRKLTLAVETADAIVTSGGAWTGDRDLVAKVLLQMGWEQIFHRIRIGPGKAVGFGLLRDKPVFILPGGPPSNLMGFLQIALPGLLRLAGHKQTGLPEAKVRLASDLKGRHADWTQFIYGTVDMAGDGLTFKSLKGKSRLRSMAQAQAVAAVPEGKTLLPAGSMVTVQLLT